MSLRLALVIAALGAALLTGAWISRGFWQPALERAVAAAFNAQDDADARGREVEQNNITAEGTARRADQRQAARDATHQLELQQQDDPYAETPLSPSSRRRLSAHDGELCRLSPRVCQEPAGSPPAAP